MRGCVREGRDSRNYSVEREIGKNRRERDSHLGWTEDLGDAWGEAKMQKYRRRYRKERKRESVGYHSPASDVTTNGPELEAEPGTPTGPKREKGG